MNRAEIKQLSREAMRNADPKGWILMLAIMLVSGLILTVFENVLPLALGIPADYVAGEISSYNIPEWKIAAIDILSIIGMLITLPFTLSFCRWALNTARGEDNESFAIMFFGFRQKNRVFRFLLMNIIISIVAIGIYLAELFLFLFLIALMGLDANYALYIIIILAAIFAVAAFGIVLVYRWRMAEFIMAEDAEIKAIDALKASGRLMKGHKAELFVFDISFILWGLLIICTFGLAAFWVGAYITVANANFYRKLIGEIPPREELSEQEIPVEEKKTDYEAYLDESENSTE